MRRNRIFLLFALVAILEGCLNKKETTCNGYSDIYRMYKNAMHEINGKTKSDTTYWLVCPINDSIDYAYIDSIFINNDEICDKENIMRLVIYVKREEGYFDTLIEVRNTFQYNFLKKNNTKSQKIEKFLPAKS